MQVKYDNSVNTDENAAVFDNDIHFLCSSSKRHRRRHYTV